MPDRFRLETVLKHRKHLEEKAQKAFSEACRKWEQARNALDVNVGHRQQYQQILKDKMHRQGNAAELLLYLRYLRRLDRDIKSQTGEVNGLETVKEEKYAQLLAAAKNRKVIDNFKERCREVETRKTLGQEQKQLNEAGVSRYHAHARQRDTT